MNKLSKITDTLTKSSSYPISRLSARFEPIDQRYVLSEAEKMLGAVTRGKLSLIVDQIRSLQEQAKKIIQQEELNMELHKASCSFEKRSGHVYHLYDRSEGELYFSMLSPEEWGGNPPHKFVGSFRLEADMSWSEVNL